MGYTHHPDEGNGEAWRCQAWIASRRCKRGPAHPAPDSVQSGPVESCAIESEIELQRQLESMHVSVMSAESEPEYIFYSPNLDDDGHDPASYSLQVGFRAPSLISRTVTQEGRLERASLFAGGTVRNRLSDPTVLRALDWLEM
jgi:hypothetical protein